MAAKRDSRQLICEELQREDALAHGPYTSDWMVFNGRQIETVSTPCNFGGERWWFLCPACGRRCRYLYPRVCRTCKGARYRSESESPANRLINKALKIRARLGQTKNGLCAPFPPKPKRMRWHTYFHIRKEAKELEARIWRNAKDALPKSTN